MHNLQSIPDSNFIHKGHNMGSGMTGPQAQVFANEVGLDSAIGSTVPTKDKPHLTMNDKVYAARIATFTAAGVHSEPLPNEAPEEPVAEPKPEPKPEPTKAKK